MADPAKHRFIVLATYRHLQRAMRRAFEGDHEVHRSAVAYARQLFREGQADHSLAIGSKAMAARIEHAQGVTQILRENVVQGKKVGSEGERYRLKIREETQRLDNEDTRKLKGTTKSFRDIKNATF